MKIFAPRQVKVSELVGFICDKCNREFSADTALEPEQLHYELGERLSLHWCGGYGSRTFGDMVEVEVDLCQYCVYDLFKDIARTDWREEL